MEFRTGWAEISLRTGLQKDFCMFIIFPELILQEKTVRFLDQVKS